MASERRPDSRGTETRAKLLDAAEHLLMEEGYAAVTSRRVGSRSGVAAQLVHYHFRSMDELFVGMIRRQGEAGCAAFEQLIETEPSLVELWDFQAGQPLSAASAELVALANHRPAVRAEIARYGQRFRRLHTQAVAAALERAGLSTELLPPGVLTVVMTATIQLLSQERAVGMTGDDEGTAVLLRALAEGLEQVDRADIVNGFAAALRGH